MINEIITIDGNDYQIIENYNDKLYLTKEVGKRNLFYYWSKEIIDKIKRKLLSKKEYQIEYIKNNPDKRKKWARTYYAKYREELIEKQKIYNQLHKAEARIRSRNYKLRKKLKELKNEIN